MDEVCNLFTLLSILCTHLKTVYWLALLLLQPYNNSKKIYIYGNVRYYKVLIVPAEGFGLRPILLGLQTRPFHVLWAKKIKPSGPRLAMGS